MKKTKLMGLAAITFLLIGSLVLFTACPPEPENNWGEDEIYTVTFNGNTNTGGSAPAAVTQAAAGAAVTIPGKGSLEKTGYEFTGWNTLANGNGLNIAEGPFTPSTDTTLYAKWVQLASDQYLITLVADPVQGGHFTDTDGVTITTITATKDVAAAFKVVESSTHDLASVKAGGVDVPVAAGVYSYTQATTTAVTITAAFTIKSSDPVQININYNGFGGTNSSVSKIPGETLTKPATPTNPLQSYTYRYAWFDEAEGGNEIPFPYVVTEAITIYARVAFLDRNDYDVRVHSIQWNNNAYLAQWNYTQYQSLAQGVPGSLFLVFVNPRTATTNLLRINPFSEGELPATFWFQVPDLIALPPGITGASVLPDDVIGSTGARGDSYNNQLAFTTGGVEAVAERSKIIAGDLDNVMVFDFTNHPGWPGWTGFSEGNRDNELGGVTIIRVETWIPNTSVELPNVRFTVSFDGNTNTGGSAPAAVTQAATGANVTIPGAGTLVKDGFEFKGWNTLASGTGIDIPAGAYKPTKSMTLFAKWERVATAGEWDRSNYDIFDYWASNTTRVGSAGAWNSYAELDATFYTKFQSVKSNPDVKIIYWLNAGDRYNQPTANLLRIGGWDPPSADNGGASIFQVNRAFMPLVTGSQYAPAVFNFEDVIGKKGHKQAPGGGNADVIWFDIDETYFDADRLCFLAFTPTTFEAIPSVFPGGASNGVHRYVVQGNGITMGLFVEIWVPSTGGEKYTVSFNGNENTGGTAPAARTQSASGAAVTIPGKGDLVKTGFEFNGWNTLANGNGNDVAEGSPYTPLDNITLFAKWDLLPLDEYTITLTADPAAGGYFTDESGVTITRITAIKDAVETFKVVTNPDYELVSVKAGSADVSAAGGVYSYTQSATDPVTITATFTKTNYTITLIGNPGGHFTDAGGTKITSITAAKDVAVTFKIVADSDYSIVSVKAGGIDVEEEGGVYSYTQTIANNITIVAFFAAEPDENVWNRSNYNVYAFWPRNEGSNVRYAETNADFGIKFDEIADNPDAKIIFWSSAGARYTITPPANIIRFGGWDPAGGFAVTMDKFYKPLETGSVYASAVFNYNNVLGKKGIGQNVGDSQGFWATIEASHFDTLCFLAYSPSAFLEATGSLPLGPLVEAEGVKYLRYYGQGNTNPGGYIALALFVEIWVPK